MRNVLVSCCAAAAMISAASLVTPTPADAWGYRYGAYRPYAYTYRPYAYRPYAYRPYYRPYGAYAYAGFGPRIWLRGGRRWR
jgi:hypothetical protein